MVRDVMYKNEVLKTTLSGPRSASGLNRFLFLFIFVMDDAERRGKLRGGQMLAKDECPPLGLPASYPAECQSMTAGMRAGCPAVAHSCA